MPATIRKAAQSQIPARVQPVGEREAQHHEHEAADERGHAEQHCPDPEPAGIGLEFELRQIDFVLDEL